MKQTTTCDRCGSKATAEVKTEGFEDEPERFSLTVTCAAGCPTYREVLTPQQMHDRTGATLNGWTDRE